MEAVDRTLSRSALARAMVDGDSDGIEYPSVKQYSAINIGYDADGSRAWATQEKLIN